VVPGRGDPCPRCCQPTEIREHPEITEKHLRQPYYYSRWFFCKNPRCKVTTYMHDRYRVYSDQVVAKEAAARGEVIWGDTWDDSPLALAAATGEA
jgi:hypothetical protein